MVQLSSSEPIETSSGNQTKHSGYSLSHFVDFEQILDGSHIVTLYTHTPSTLQLNP